MNRARQAHNGKENSLAQAIFDEISKAKAMPKNADKTVLDIWNEIKSGVVKDAEEMNVDAEQVFLTKVWERMDGLGYAKNFEEYRESMADPNSYQDERANHEQLLIETGAKSRRAALKHRH